MKPNTSQVINHQIHRLKSNGTRKTGTYQKEILDSVGLGCRKSKHGLICREELKKYTQMEDIQKKREEIENAPAKGMSDAERQEKRIRQG